MTKNLRKNKKFKITIYLVLRILVVISLIFQATRSDWENVFLCILTLLLFTIPSIINKTFHIKLPTVLETIVYLFIFSAEILGEIQNFYGIIPYWDNLLHIINGFIAAAIGFSLVDILNQNKNISFKMTPIFVALTAFSFSMTVGVIWEIFEYTADNYLNVDMQKDTYIDEYKSVLLNPDKENIPVVVKDIEKVEITTNNNKIIILEDGYIDIGLHDTMIDLIVNLYGAITFSILGFLYLKNREGFKFTELFIPIIRKRN